MYSPDGGTVTTYQCDTLMRLYQSLFAREAADRHYNTNKRDKTTIKQQPKRTLVTSHRFNFASLLMTELGELITNKKQFPATYFTI